MQSTGASHARASAVYLPPSPASSSNPCQLGPATDALYRKCSRLTTTPKHALIRRLRHLVRTSSSSSESAPLGSPLPSASATSAKPTAAQSRKKVKDNTPLQQRILNGVLGVSNVPYSSFVPAPATFLHGIDARIKQLWLVTLYLLIARSSPPLRVAITAALALITIAAFPPRLWKPQLGRLLALAALIFAFTALGSDGIPPVLQPREPPPEMLLPATAAATAGAAASTAAAAAATGSAADAASQCVPLVLPPLQPTGYNYVILHVWFITVTHRSLNLALTASALTFCALQAASLCLITTPGEEMAVALRWWLRPLKPLGVPAQEIALTLLLSLRFMSLVFEEVRNLCLGLAARGVDWAAQGGRGSIEIGGRLAVKLFANLFQRSEVIAQAMVVRGFAGPEHHQLYMMTVNKPSVLANFVSLALLVALIAGVNYYR